MAADADPTAPAPGAPPWHSLPAFSQEQERELDEILEAMNDGDLRAPTRDSGWRRYFFGDSALLQHEDGTAVWVDNDAELDRDEPDDDDDETWQDCIIQEEEERTGWHEASTQALAAEKRPAEETIKHTAEETKE